nr:nucleotide sugar dehydrogenase [Natronococcus jeotgali]
MYDSTASSEAQSHAFRSSEIPVAVYGLGKMGLPLASVFAETSGNITGADVDPDVVETINNGNCHVKREPGLPELVDDLVDEQALQATTEPRNAADDASVHVIIVPTPITDEKEPDLAILDTVVEDIGNGLDPGDLVIVECTVPPQTTEKRVLPALEDASGLSLGDFGLAFCPERTSSGRALEDIRGAYPKVVGGVDNESTRAASLIYEQINEQGVLPVSDATTAEAVKVFEGLYRDVNIALANELATFTNELGIDVNEAIETANTQPFCDIHDPGPGVGGHCIPYYPYFLIKPFETESPLLETARDVNDLMPEFTVEKVREGLQADGKSLEDSTVAILGLTYRPGVEEIRASPSIAISELLDASGADVYGVDPMLDSVEEFALEQVPLSDLDEFPVDALILVTPHEDFGDINWDDIHRNYNSLSVVIDGRQTLEDDLELCKYTIGGGYSE